MNRAVINCIVLRLRDIEPSTGMSLAFSFPLLSRRWRLKLEQSGPDSTILTRTSPDTASGSASVVGVRTSWRNPESESCQVCPIYVPIIKYVPIINFSHESLCKSLHVCQLVCHNFVFHV